jgi:Cys-tRNA(Pro)/Cys-tRNA(Cys) deacylase
MKKTNAARLLDTKSIHYDLAEYKVDESDLSAVTLARKIGQDVEQVFKTLVLRGDKTGVFVCVVPGNTEVDLKKAAKVSGNRNCAMIHQKELLPLTGYIRGGCSPIGMKKPFPTFIHETCQLFDTIFVSAGQRGLQLVINPEDLIKVTGSVVCVLVE